MSKISLILVVTKIIKTNEILNDMAKVQIKPEKFTPFGGLFYVANQFKRHIMPYADNYLGRRCRLVGYQYGEILLAMTCNFFSGGNRTEDINVLKNKLPEHPGFDICSIIF